MSEELKAAQARIAELEGALSWHEEQRNDMAEIRAELAAIKAQEPVAWAGAIEYGVPLLMVEPQNWKATPLYAAPVSEAKAQGEYGDAYQGAREDLAIWKRRALEAEKALQEERIITERLGNALNEENGPTFMGEPVFPAKAKGVVMPERWNVPRPMWKDVRQPYGNPLNHADIEAAEKFNLALDEVVRLNAATAAPEADAGIVDMYRHLQKVTPYRFKKIQDASITDGGDVMYFHKDRFDAALLADMAAHCAAPATADSDVLECGE